MVVCNGRVREFSADGLQAGERAYLIHSHEPAVANDVACEDRGKPSLNGWLIRHLVPPAWTAQHRCCGVEDKSGLLWAFVDQTQSAADRPKKSRRKALDMICDRQEKLLDLHLLWDLLFSLAPGGSVAELSANVQALSQHGLFKPESDGLCSLMPSTKVEARLHITHMEFKQPNP
jgi:hypothetical protein